MTMTQGETGLDPGTAQQVAGQVAGETKQQAGELARDAWGEARTVVHRATDQARTQVDEQARKAAGGVRSFSQQLQALAEGRATDAGDLRTWAGQASRQLQSLADRVDREGVQGLADDVGAFARRRPGLFLAACAAAGFVAGRVARAAKAESGSMGSGPRGNGSYAYESGAYGSGAYGTGSSTYGTGVHESTTFEGRSPGPAGTGAVQPPLDPIPGGARPAELR